MGVIIGFGTINTLAAYYCIKDSEVEPLPDFWFLAMQSAASCFWASSPSPSTLVWLVAFSSRSYKVIVAHHVV